MFLIDTKQIGRKGGLPNADYQIQFLQIAGGGGGGPYTGAGGGAGGYINSYASETSGGNSVTAGTYGATTVSYTHLTLPTNREV